MDFFSTTITQEGIDEVNSTLKSGLISAGKKAEQLEQILSNDFGFVNSITLNSGTSALHLALEILKIGKGDEVILPAQTFIATGLAILYTGAKPVFCDINTYDGNLNIESLESKITEKTKAIMVFHWGGYPVDLDRVQEIADKYNLKVIEDAAHAFGAVYKGRKIGSISDFTCFSLQAIKHVTSGDGGILCCKNYDDYLLGKRLSWFDIDRENSKPDLRGERVYDATNIGYKYHMNDISASLAIGNLKTFSKKQNRLQEIAKFYFDNIKDSRVKLMKYDEDRKSAYWSFPLVIGNREYFISRLKSVGIPTTVLHLGIDKNTIFGGIDETLEGQRWFDERQINIPIHDQLTDDDVQLIVNTINSIW